MELSLLEKHGWIEALSRVFLERHPKLKKIVKNKRNKRSHESGNTDKMVPDPKQWEDYRRQLYEAIAENDIILIHSSTDGLDKMGVSAQQCLEFLKSLIKDKGCTIVMACFPVTNLKPPTEKSRPYDPEKTMCWTGMLPNMFIAEPECIRTRFPYNSLAAMGPKAGEMMEKDLNEKQVYGRNSAWHYCYEHHAKIFFIGVRASGSNTMAIHMVPDVMGDDWPVEGWYNERIYKVRLNGEIVEVPVLEQKGFWYKYVMEEGTSGRLKRAGLLTEQSIGGCNLGIVQDSHIMIDYLVEQGKQKKLAYLIPGKYYKKNKRKAFKI